MRKKTKKCPIPGCGAPPEEMENKVRCSNTKCEFCEWVTRVLWQAFARTTKVCANCPHVPSNKLIKPRMPKKKAVPLNPDVRKRADYILGIALEKPVTARQICRRLWPILDADPEQTLTMAHPDYVTRLCSRLEALGEMTIDKSTRPYLFKTISRKKV